MSRLVLIVEDSETCAETLQIALEPILGVEVRSIHSRRAGGEITSDDVNKLSAVAGELRRSDCDPFIVFAKTSSFTAEEIEICKGTCSMRWPATLPKYGHRASGIS